MTQQNEMPAKRPVPRQESRLERAVNNWDLADATAVKAVYNGTADAGQQRRAMEWILKGACGVPDWPYVPGDADQTHIHLGRQFVGQQIMKLIQLNPSAVRRRESRADEPEPQS